MARKPHPAVQLLSDLVTRDDDAIDLPAAALAVARVENDDVDPIAHLALLRRFGDEIADHIERVGGDDKLGRFSRYFADELGFYGRNADYDDPRNSCLNQVLARRTGLPILLSLVYIELAAACGIICEGVGFPGHFLVRCIDNGCILDPFHKGRQLTEQDCHRLLERQGLPADRWRDEFLAPARKREILQRILNNLHRHYSSVGDSRRLHLVVSMVRALRLAGQTEGGWIH